MRCRFCNNELKHVFMDLVNAPLSNSYLTYEQLNEPEIYYPLKVFVCDACWLVQVDEYQNPDKIFNADYAYFSSYSKSWLKHAESYTCMITNRLGLNNQSKVIEIASNDGYLLQYFKEKEIPCIGIEPTASTAKTANEKGIETIEEFFTSAFAKEMVEKNFKAELIIGNNVLAHIPDINDFIKGLKLILKKNGTITLEFPHLLKLINYNQFDTIYHEHFSYLSLIAVTKIFKNHGLILYDVEELTTHGGSLRIYIKHRENSKLSISKNLNTLIMKEKNFGLSSIDIYETFQKKADHVKLNFLKFLLTEKKQGKKIAAYGAAAKGNTLLNYCGIKNGLIDFVADASPHKQAKYLPGSHIPIVHENIIKKTSPDYVVLFPWNLKNELVEQLDYIRHWGGKFITAVPELEVF